MKLKIYTIEEITKAYAITPKQAGEVIRLQEKLHITTDEALELIEFDKTADKPSKQEQEEKEVKKAKPKKKTGIQEGETDQMKSLLKAEFEGKEFQNKDLDNLRQTLGLSPRQTPSRLKKLVDEGFLEDLGGTPKKYKIK